MKKIIPLLSLALLALSGFAQAPAPAAFIKGDMHIDYRTRLTDKPKEGVTDVYTLEVNVSNSAIFKGKIEHVPMVKNTFTRNAPPKLVHALDIVVVNPDNLAQRAAAGKLLGTVPIDENNVYRYDDGDLRMSINSIGRAPGFEAPVKGLAFGKPPKVTGWFDKIKKDAVSITRLVGGKTVKIEVKEYDEMKFQNHVLAAGPVRRYSDASVNGTMLYDYGRGAWHFRNIMVLYTDGGQQKQDILSGTILWVETNHKTTGVGEYQFDIRINEPPASEMSIFSAAADESAFFSADTTIPALVGTMKYKDTMRSGKPVESRVVVDLRSNKLSQVQVMYLAKLLLVSAVVPINNE